MTIYLPAEFGKHDESEKLVHMPGLRSSWFLSTGDYLSSFKLMLNLLSRSTRQTLVSLNLSNHGTVMQKEWLLAALAGVEEYTVRGQANDHDGTQTRKCLNSLARFRKLRKLDLND